LIEENGSDIVWYAARVLELIPNRGTGEGQEDRVNIPDKRRARRQKSEDGGQIVEVDVHVGEKVTVEGLCSFISTRARSVVSFSELRVNRKRRFDSDNSSSTCACSYASEPRVNE
jgi:hypothetical protein